MYHVTLLNKNSISTLVGLNIPCLGRSNILPSILLKSGKYARQFIKLYYHQQSTMNNFQQHFSFFFIKSCNNFTLSMLQQLAPCRGHNILLLLNNQPPAIQPPAIQPIQPPAVQPPAPFQLVQGKKQHLSS